MVQYPKYTTILMLCISYQIGRMVNHITEHEYICDCEKMYQFDVVDRINDHLITDNARLYRDLYISLDYINYTNMGNVYYTPGISSEEVNLVSLPLESFINDFYEFKTSVYGSIKKLIDSKRELYRQYIKLKHRCE